MKVTYKFVTGEVLEIEVDEKVGAEIAAIEHAADNQDRAETRRHHSLEDLAEQGYPFADDYDLAAAVEEFMLNEQLYAAIAALQPRQRKLLHALFVQRRSSADIARTEGVSRVAIHDRLKKILDRLNKIYEKGLTNRISRG